MNIRLLNKFIHKKGYHLSKNGDIILFYITLIKIYNCYRTKHIKKLIICLSVKNTGNIKFIK